MRRFRRLRIWLAAAVVGTQLAMVTGMLPSGHTGRAWADDTTASHNNLRTGWDPNEPGLSPAVVGGGRFGQKFSTAVNGKTYAQPLVVGSMLIVATENDWVYGLNATTGHIVWQRSLGTPYHITSCAALTPNIGVTGSPVYDAANGNVYLIAQVMSSTGPTYRMFGLKAKTGKLITGPLIHGTATNKPGFAFSPTQELQRPGLLLMNGWIYAAFGSHCDSRPYTGFVAGVNVGSGRETLWADETGATDGLAGIWQSGSGLMSDGPGRIFFASGNGTDPAPGPGSPPGGHLGESVVRLAVQPSGSLVARDFFSPANAPALDTKDIDLGSGGPVGLPFGTRADPDLLVQAGKDGRLFMLNRDHLGGREQGPHGTDAAVGVFGPFKGEWNHPAAFADTPTLTPADSAAAHDFIYYLGTGDRLRILKAGVTGSGTPTLTDVANTANYFGYSSGAPVVTSNGTTASSAVVWDVYASGPYGGDGTLRAYRAVPPGSCTGAAPCAPRPIWSASIGTAVKFEIPAVSNGMVYVAAAGHVLGFGSTAPPARTAGRGRPSS